MINHEYVTLKLVNGDNIICVLVDEDDNRFVVMYPLQMKTVKVNTDGISNKEIIAGSPWCPFTDHEVFQIWKNDVMIIKPLNLRTIEYYKRLVDLEQDNFYGEEPFLDDEDSEDSDDQFFIFGNPTLH